MPRTRTDFRLTYVVLCAGVSAFSMLQSMVNPVLPTIQAALDTDQRTVTWLLTAYLLSASVFTPIVGRIGDKVGKERMLVVALGALAVGSLIAAVAPTIGVLIFARVVQGVGGGVLPLTFGIIRDEFPSERVAGAIGTAAALLAVGGALGLVVAGPLVEALSYHWLFWLPMVLTAVAALAAWLFVPASPVRTEGRIDVRAAVLLSGWLVCLLLPVSQGRDWGWSSPLSLGLFVASALLCALWVRTELRSDAPLIDMGMMRLPAVWTTNLVSLLFGVGMYAGYAFLPQFLQTPERAGYGFGATVTGAGLLMLPSTLIMLVAGPWAGRLATRANSRLPLVLGAGIGAVAFGFYAVAHAEVWEIAVGGVLLGTGIGFSFSAMANLVVGAVPREEGGVATGINTIMRSLGGALGAQLVATLLTTQTIGNTPMPSQAAYTDAFIVAAIAAALALVAALMIPVVRRPQAQPVTVPAPA